MNWHILTLGLTVFNLFVYWRSGRVLAALEEHNQFFVKLERMLENNRQNMIDLQIKNMFNIHDVPKGRG